MTKTGTQKSFVAWVSPPLSPHLPSPRGSGADIREDSIFVGGVGFQVDKIIWAIWNGRRQAGMMAQVGAPDVEVIN